jgi:hypothetical protein
VLALLLAVTMLAPVEVERVVAVVNGAPVLASDVEVAELGRVVPRQEGEDDTSYRRAVAEALVALQLRWQDLESAGIASRLQVDTEGAWKRTLERAGGEQEVQERLSAAGLPESLLRELVDRAATVEAYVADRFAPFSRPTPREVEEAYAHELLPAVRKAGGAPPPLEEVRGKLETLLQERKLNAEVERWTAELEQRGVVVRYFR